VQQTRMNALLEIMSKELQRSIPLDCPLDKIPDRGSSVPCPMCGAQMENYGYMGANFVMLDACHACRMLWLDTLELGAMAVEFARTTRRVDVIRMQEESDRLELARTAEALVVANTVGRLMLKSFIIAKLLP
jgi:Zn-finger nucleic acid-binding protein